MDEMIEHFKKMYPDEMVLVEMSDFERGKGAGMVELLKEMQRWYEDEYSAKLGKS